MVQVHREYLNAGSMAVITNTLTMNSAFIRSHGLNIDVTAVNIEGAKLAREAVQGKAYVLGNLSSTGRLLEPYGDFSEKAALDSLVEQAGLLRDGGVDGFIIETIIDLREAILAVKACKEVSTLPVLACIAFDMERNGGRTVMGNSAAECAYALQEEGVSALGANCGSIDPGRWRAWLERCELRPACLLWPKQMRASLALRTTGQFSIWALRPSLSACCAAGKREP